jgi:hypothetical protein
VCGPCDYGNCLWLLALAGHHHAPAHAWFQVPQDATLRIGKEATLRIGEEARPFSAAPVVEGEGGGQGRRGGAGGGVEDMDWLRAEMRQVMSKLLALQVRGDEG